MVILLIFSLIPLNSFAEEVEGDPVEEPIEVTEPEEEAEPAEESPEEEAEPAEELPEEEAQPEEDITEPVAQPELTETEEPAEEEEEALPLEDEMEVSEEESDVAPMADEPVSMSIDEAEAVMYASLEEALAALALTGPATADIVVSGDTSSTTPRVFSGYVINITGTDKHEVSLAPLNIVNGSLVVTNLLVKMAPVVGTDFTLMLGSTAEGDTTVTFDNVVLNMNGGQSTYAHAINLQGASGYTNTLNFVNKTHATITGYISTGTKGNAIYTEKEATQVINIIDSELYSLANRSGYAAGAKTYVNVIDGVFHTLDSIGNGSNGAYFTAVRSDINFSRSGAHGLSVTQLTLEDSIVRAEENTYTGVWVNTSGATVKNSVMEINNNKVSLDTLGAFYLRGGKNTIDGLSQINITGNTGTGLRLHAGELVVSDAVDPGKFVVMYNTATWGGGIEVNAGNMVLPKTAIIYNNRASKEADDIYVAEGAKLTLHPVGKDWELKESPEWEEDHLIDGWYDDAEETRWSAHIDPIYVNELIEEDLGELDGPLTLKAAHTELVDIPVEKIWVDGPLVKPTITIHLLADGEVVASVDLENGVTEHIFKNFPKFADNEEIVYTVGEDQVENYLTTIKLDEETGKFIITNTFVSPKIDITVNKVWIDGPEVKPEISVQLYRNGDAYGDPVVIKSPELTYTWKDLDELDKEGNPYNYTVDELEVPTNYEKTVDGLTITNRYVIPKIDVTAKKTWVDGPADKPDVTLQLMKDGKAFGDPVVLKHPAVSYTWKDLDQTTAKGEPIVYTVDELNVPEGYVKTASGLEVTNTFMMAKSDITATKKWVGGPEKKPVIQLQLYRDGKAFGEVVELDGVTTYTWKDLDKHSPEGKVYVYTVKETVVPNYYKATYSEDGLTVTNTWTKEELPKTGMGSSTWMLILGSLLLIGGAVVFLRKKQNGNAS